MPYPQQEAMMHPYPPQQNGGFELPYHDPYHQAAYTPNEQVPLQSMNAGTLPGSSVMQPMQQPNQQMQGNPQIQPNQQMQGNPQIQPNQQMQG
ncbi:hypothetical protein ACQKL5_03095, partial [Peribacillus sp. NPDC097675]|uniref:hypothetical protein n=1 Tax=Peribacillus sp. NPDC097675 TaxID=3390618 RepID=UPI003D000960